MIVGLGIDIVELDRIHKALQRFGDRFSRRILTRGELDAMPGTEQAGISFLAARFAAKEAGVKALGTGMSGGITWHDLEVRPLPSGKPEIILHGPAQAVANSLGARMAHVSLTHGRDTAAAVVILETGQAG
ncbi:MAG: holo-[acyl-carrier-protein] synthase [Desulfohalobiaceae bacterium]